MAAPTIRNATPNETTNSTAGTTTTMVAPPGLADDDVMYVLLVLPASTNMTPPSGWTQVTNQTSNHDGGRSAIFRKVASSESGNYDFTHDSDLSYGIICAVVGADTATPEAATPSPNTNNDTNPDPPASGTVASGDYLSLAWFGQENKSVATTTPPSGYVDEQSGGTSGSGGPAGHGGGGLASLGLTAATSEDPGTFLSAISDGWAAFTILVGAEAPTALARSQAVVII